MSAGDSSFVNATVWPLAIAWVVGALCAVSGCRSHETQTVAPAPSASVIPGGLSPELAGKVLAHVGDTAITLGDYAAVLDRMDWLERLRYQTADRRKQLLDELINVELLAREAERRGLQNRPETKELIRQILRSEVVAELRDKLPSVESIPASEVRAYYDARRADFNEPQRRRVSQVVVADAATAKRVLDEAANATPKQWGELVQMVAQSRARTSPTNSSATSGSSHRLPSARPTTRAFRSPFERLYSRFRRSPRSCRGGLGKVPHRASDGGERGERLITRRGGFQRASACICSKSSCTIPKRSSSASCGPVFQFSWTMLHSPK